MNLSLKSIYCNNNIIFGLPSNSGGLFHLNSFLIYLIQKQKSLLVNGLVSGLSTFEFIKASAASASTFNSLLSHSSSSSTGQGIC